MESSFWTHLSKGFLHFLHVAGTKIIYVALAIIIGIILIRISLKLIRRWMKKAEVELSLQSFLISLSTLLLYSILFFVIGVILGIKASAFVTAFGAAGIAIGLALQGSLANFAGGVLILLFRPFKIGDEVVIEGSDGVVDQIDILYTRIKTYDGKMITLPNGKVSNNKIINNTQLPMRRVDINLHFSLHEDVDRLRELLTNTMKKHPDIIKDKPVQVWLNEFGEYYMKLSARCWAPTPIFWDVYWDQIEAIKKALDKNEIPLEIPKQKMEVQQVQK